MKSLGLLAALAVGSAPGLFPGLSPQQPSSTCQAGDRALALKQLELARAEYEKCLTQDEPRLETLSNLGTVNAQLGRFDEAIKAYSRALALNPDSPPLHMNMGLAYLKTGRAREAATEFARALMGDPENMKAQELLAFCHYQTKDYELAAVEAERVLKALPNEDSAGFLLGSAYLKLGLYKRAIPLLYYSTEKTNSVDAHMILGEAFLGVKAYRQALREFEKARAFSADTPGLHAELGQAYAGLGEADKATAEFEKELAGNPDDFESNYYLGRLRRLSNSMEDAQKFLAKAEKLRPGNPSVQYEYAVLALQARDYAKAEALLLGILQQVPNYTDAHVLLSQVYFKTHRQREGEREKSLVDAMKKSEQAEIDAEGEAIKAMGEKTASPAQPSPR